MSLQGSLETFQLPDVLVLLANTKKSGELRVVGGRVDGRVWLREGQLVQTLVGKSTEPVDALWELLRLSDGTFSFADGTPPKPGSPQLVDLVLADAQARLAEWREIEKVVPSLHAHVTIRAEAPGDDVIISASQWKVFAAVGDGRSVQALMERLGMGEFDACRWLRELKEADLIEISTDVAPAAQADPQPDVEPVTNDLGAAEDALLRPAKKRKNQPEPAPVAEAPVEPAVVAEPEPVPAAVAVAELPSADEASALVAQLAALNGGDEEAAAAAVAAVAADGDMPILGDDGEPINRGLLLKFLSSVRS